MKERVKFSWRSACQGMIFKVIHQPNRGNAQHAADVDQLGDVWVPSGMELAGVGWETA